MSSKRDLGGEQTVAQHPFRPQQTNEPSVACERNYLWSSLDRDWEWLEDKMRRAGVHPHTIWAQHLISTSKGG